MRSKIPTSVYKEFLDFLNQENVETKLFYNIDEDGEEHLYRKAVTKSPRDLKAVISLFEKKYPAYFDPITVAKIKQLNSNDDESNNVSNIVKDMFTITDDD